MNGLQCAFAFWTILAILRNITTSICITFDLHRGLLIREVFQEEQVHLVEKVIEIVVTIGCGDVLILNGQHSG
jgi:hypothetical protein